MDRDRMCLVLCDGCESMGVIAHVLNELPQAVLTEVRDSCPPTVFHVCAEVERRG
jgi:hypothetical protein